ncbi:MAG: SDR family oxidoreductase [Gammaproteobacteria bacterium]|nr:SDR family oxidoreductase [Gammaproteobacteria bacterium]
MGFEYKGATALITGASSGIGEAFAKILAERGCNLILVARSEDVLNQLAGDLHDDHGVTVDVMAADLSEAVNCANVADAADALGRRVDLLINNAGFGTMGPFVKADADRERQEIDLNVTALTDLCHAFLPGMVERGQGAVINVASTASFQPMPYLAVYAATKAYVRSLSEALHAECKDRGVTVTALCPGPVATNFFEATQSKDIDGMVKKVAGIMMTSEQVALDALKAMEKGRAVVVPGAPNKLGAMAASLTPNRMLTSIMAKTMKG